MVAAPVSILDGDDVRGSHPSSSAPSIGGNEGLAIVEQAADGVNLKVGQWVIPNSKHFGGTWRSHAVVSADLVDPVPSNIEVFVFGELNRFSRKNERTLSFSHLFNSFFFEKPLTTFSA